MEEIRSDQQVVEIQANTSQIESKVKSLQVVDTPSNKLATDYLSFIKKAHRTIEARRKFFVQPLNEHVKEINNFFKSMTDPLKDHEASIKDKMLGYHRVCEAKAEAARKVEQAKADATAKELELPPVEVEKKEVKTQTQGSMGKTFIQKRWTYDLMDIRVVPTAYIILDSTAINNAIRAGIREIPGLKIYQKEGIGSR